MADDANRTERGRPPAPFGTEDTLAAPVTPAEPKRWTPPGAEPAAEPAPPTVEASASLSLPHIDRVRYRVLGEVGRGGIGRVSRARDLYLDRPVAVKELLDSAAPAQRRFVREALITARLQHPAIVPIYDAGMSDEQGPFYTMKLVAGRSLADKLADARTLDQRLALLPNVIAVVDAMAYAHSERIIHRDLKPQNVLVGAYGETMLIDWGLAKDLNAKEAVSVGPYASATTATETLDGAVMGTPAFMAPEQATAGDAVDERADVYALGAMLYFLGAGVPPHAGTSVDEMLVKVVAGDVMPLAEREPRIPVDLAAIVGKAMAHDPAKRYRDARELSEDLHKFQTGKLVGAKTYTRGERLRRWVGRNRRLVGVTTGALAILLAYGGWSVSRIYAERRRAEDEAARAVAAATEAAAQRDSAIAQAMLVRARQYAATGHAAEELAVLRVLARPDAGALARRLAIDEGGLVWKSHQRLAMALGHEVGMVLRSADGARFLATEPGAIVAWDVATGRELVRAPLEGTATAAARFGKLAAISPTGRFAVVTACAQAGDRCAMSITGDESFQLGADTRLELRELATGQVLATWQPTEQLRRRELAFAVDDSAVAIRRGDHIQVLGAGARELAVAGCAGPLAIAPGGAHVAVGCKDRVWLDGAVVLTGTPAAAQLAFPTADRLVAIGATVALWDVARGELRGHGALPDAPDATSARDEGEDIEWAYVRPRVPGVAIAKPHRETPQIRIGSSMSIVPRTSLLGPPPRLVAGGALLTLEGPDWQALVLDADRVRYGLVDALVPSEPPERCLPRVGGERHATVALDGGARMLVDAQELATGLAAAPPEGYRHTTTDELPVRQLRPLVAAEADTCLVWGAAIGAHVRDGGALAPEAHVASDGDGGLVVVEPAAGRAAHVARDGTRTPIATAELPIESPDGRFVASIDPDRDELRIAAVKTGAVVRTAKLGPDADGARWVALDVVEAGGLLVAADPAIAPRPREAELVTEPHGRYGARRDGGDLVVVRVADNIEVARHAIATGATIRPLPDDSGAIVVERDRTHEVVARSRTRVTLAPNRHVRLGALAVEAGFLVSRTDDSVAVWELATGRAFAIPLGARDVAIRGGELWAVSGGRKPTLVRIRLDGKGTRETRLATAGVPFQQVTTGLQISPDGTRLTAAYALTDELTALATWDAETGTLVWVGPPAARVVGDWIAAGGRVYVPAFELDALLHDTGARTNLRVCRDDLRAVPVVPPPAADTFWAPAEACR